MNYFTPERYAALQDFSTDAAMNAADTAWQAAVDRYAAYYASVEAQLAAGIRKTQAAYYLHDAVVFNLGRQGNRFVIVLQLDTPPNDLLVFDYELTAEPVLDRQAFPPQYQGKGAVEWLYDEVELTATNPVAFTHSILFSNGWEVRLPCRDVQVLQAAALIPERVSRSNAELHQLSETQSGA